MHKQKQDVKTTEQVCVASLHLHEADGVYVVYTDKELDHENSQIGWQTDGLKAQRDFVVKTAAYEDRTNLILLY